MNKFYDNICLRIISHVEELIKDTPDFEIEKQERLKEVVRLVKRILYGLQRDRAMKDFPKVQE